MQSRDDRSAAWNSYWLIERPVDGQAHPEYWVASALEPWLGEWTDDPWKATRYATQEDAERALRPRGGFALPGTARAVSHGFEESRCHLRRFGFLWRLHRWQEAGWGCMRCKDCGAMR